MLRCRQPQAYFNYLPPYSAPTTHKARPSRHSIYLDALDNRNLAIINHVTLLQRERTSRQITGFINRPINPFGFASSYKIHLPITPLIYPPVPASCNPVSDRKIIIQRRSTSPCHCRRSSDVIAANKITATPNPPYRFTWEPRSHSIET